jgi:hypothetical protein
MNDDEQAGTDFSGSGPVEYRPAEPTPATARGSVPASDEAKLLAIPGVTSVGLGRDAAGGEAVVVGVVDAGVASRVPREIGGVPVVIEVTGEVNALQED